MTPRVTFTYFDIPSVSCADNNYVRVYDGLNADPGTMIEQVCGPKCGDHIVHGTGRFMLVQLIVKSPGSFRGFHAKFE